MQKRKQTKRKKKKTLSRSLSLSLLLSLRSFPFFFPFFFQTVAIFLYLTRVGSTLPVRFLKSASYSEYPPSNQTTLESPSKARMWVARRSRNLIFLFFVFFFFRFFVSFSLFRFLLPPLLQISLPVSIYLKTTLTTCRARSPSWTLQTAGSPPRAPGRRRRRPRWSARRPAKGFRRRPASARG